MNIASRIRIPGLLLALPLLVTACSDSSGTHDTDAPSDNAGAPAIPAGLPDDIPFVKMGEPRSKSLLDGIREYEGIDDPERASVYTGRREVEPITDYELEGSFDSPETLAQAILDAVFFDDPKLLHTLRVSRPEFDYLVWTEFPQSRPATNITAGDAWAFHEAACNDGISELVDRHGKEELHLVEVKYTEGLAPYTNFNVVKGVILWVVDDEGNDIFLDQVPTFLERNGRWKVYMYKG